MKNPFSFRMGITIAGAAAAWLLGSCAYDPYYSSAGGSYSSGYGHGYGYGSSNFSTSLFVSTGDPRWGYDPHCYSYYDYRRRAYYDPYLRGYYPVGYRPPVVIGVPHPHGWRPGRGYCPPPRSIRTVTVSNYRNREDAYRGTNYSWAKQVRTRPISDNRAHGDSRNQRSRETPSSSPFGTRSSSRESSSSRRESQYQPQRVSPSSRQKESSRLPSGYNTPVTRTPSRESGSSQRYGSRIQQPQSPGRIESRGGSRNSPSPAMQRGGGERSSPPAMQRGGGESQPRSREEIKRSIKGLGQG